MSEVTYELVESSINVNVLVSIPFIEFSIGDIDYHNGIIHMMSPNKTFGAHVVEKYGASSDEIILLWGKFVEVFNSYTTNEKIAELLSPYGYE
jgi:hypothetical protein|tara:strand:- start:2117 stop:2395 length:279 start_codon:yes stop_codon:yes gene_type:complete